MKINYEEINNLVDIPALSGHEDKLINYTIKKMQQYTDDIEIDNLGNVTATFKGIAKNPKSLMLTAHLDEIGLMVRKVEDNGFLRVERVGGMPEKTLRGQLVDIYSTSDDSYVTGVVGTISHHITPDQQKTVVPTRLDMYIDAGFENKKEAESRGIKTGSVVVYHPNFNIINEKQITGKALDNRVCVYTLFEVADYLSKNKVESTVHLVFSVQEEFNIRAITPVYENLQPDLAICLDVTPACDTPDIDGLYDIQLGSGPAITHLNFHGRGTLGGLIPNPKMRRYLEDLAEKNDISYQDEVVVGVITDDAFSQLSGKKGVLTGHISIPTRYTHSPIETVNIKDLENYILWFIKIIEDYNDSVDFSRGMD